LIGVIIGVSCVVGTLLIGAAVYFFKVKANKKAA